MIRSCDSVACYRLPEGPREAVAEMTTPEGRHLRRCRPCLDRVLNFADDHPSREPVSLVFMRPVGELMEEVAA